MSEYIHGMEHGMPDDEDLVGPSGDIHFAIERAIKVLNDSRRKEQPKKGQVKMKMFQAICVGNFENLGPGEPLHTDEMISVNPGAVTVVLPAQDDHPVRTVTSDGDVIMYPAEDQCNICMGRESAMFRVVGSVEEVTRVLNGG